MCSFQPIRTSNPPQCSYVQHVWNHISSDSYMTCLESTPVIHREFLLLSDDMDNLTIIAMEDQTSRCFAPDRIVQPQVHSCICELPEIKLTSTKATEWHIHRPSGEQTEICKHNLIEIRDSVEINRNTLNNGGCYASEKRRFRHAQQSDS
jgi:hypothetical protein